MKNNSENRRVTLEFKTKELRDEWKKWYRRDGSNYFWGSLLTHGPKWYKTKAGLRWREIAEERMTNWDRDTERFV